MLIWLIQSSVVETYGRFYCLNNRFIYMKLWHRVAGFEQAIRC